RSTSCQRTARPNKRSEESLPKPLRPRKPFRSAISSSGAAFLGVTFRRELRIQKSGKRKNFCARWLRDFFEGFCRSLTAYRRLPPLSRLANREPFGKSLQPVFF